MKIVRILSGRCRLLTAAALLSAFNLIASTNGFIVPAFRGSANSQTGYWETFTAPVGAPGNHPDQPGATTGAVLVQSNASAFLTGSGNIYNLSGTSEFSVADPASFTLGTVVLQTRTIGSELDYSSVLLSWTDDAGAHTLAPLFREELNRALSQGYSVSSLWQWDLTGLGVSHYTLSFRASGASLSFDSMTLDTAETFVKAFPEQPYALASTPANLARWMYSFNGNPDSRPTASVFGSLGSEPDFDSRDAQYLLGWNTSNTIPTGLGARNYLIRRARVTLTLASGGQYAYTGTLRDYRTYFPVDDPRRITPETTAVPVELFGVGFRGGYSALTYPQDGPWGILSGSYHSNRIAYAAGFDTNGALVDVSNNVGDDGTNEIAAPFEVAPFAVGQSTDVAEGELMPLGSRLTFDLNLDDPLIYGYLQQGLNAGNLSFVAASLVSASFSGPPNYPSFFTIFSPLATPDQFPILDLEGALIRTNLDSDGDGLPDDWENFYFGSLVNGGTNSVAGDGANNAWKYLAGFNPAAPASRLQVFSLPGEPRALELRFTAAPSRGYSIETSEDLVHWQAASTPGVIYTSDWLSKSAGPVAYPSPPRAVWRDSGLPGALRFYRVKAQ